MSSERELANSSSTEPREVEPYNHSSLALEFNRDPSPQEQALPRLISKRRDGESGVPDSPLWKGLDPLAEERSHRSRNVSLMIHILVVAGVVWLGAELHNRIIEPSQTDVAYKLYIPPVAPVRPSPKPIRGGGGIHRVVMPRKQPLLKFTRVKTLPQQIHPVTTPQPPAPPTLNANLPAQNSLPNLGASKSPQIAMASQSPDNGGGFGMGVGGSVGSGGNYGGGVMNVGGGVSAPKIIHSVDPQFTQRARQANYQGTVSIQLIVDAHGNPRDIHVVHHLGMGLDRMAVQAVRQYRFKPAMYHGHPVAVQMVIQVGFHLN